MSEHDEPVKGHPIGAYLIVFILTAAIVGIFSFLSGSWEQYWLAGVAFVLWGIASLIIFTRPEQSTH